MMRRAPYIAALALALMVGMSSVAVAAEPDPQPHDVSVTAVVPSLTISGPFVVLRPFRPPATGQSPISSRPRRVAQEPSWGSARIRFALSRQAKATVLITNRAGRLLHVHAITQPFAGPRTVYWDGRDLLGRVVPADWYRITAFARSETEAARGSSTIAVSYGPKLSFYDTKTYSTRPQTVTTTLSRAAYVSVRVVSSSGKTVRRVRPRYVPTGAWTWTWDMKTNARASVPPGGYTVYLTGRDSGANVTTLRVRYLYVPPYATVGTPRAPRTMSVGKARIVTGTLKPRHTKGSTPVRIYKYRLVNGNWKSYGYHKAKASNYSTYTKYSASVRLTKRGVWRLRAYHLADSKHPARWSKTYDYVIVR